MIDCGGSVACRPVSPLCVPELFSIFASALAKPKETGSETGGETALVPGGVVTVIPDPGKAPVPEDDAVVSGDAPVRPEPNR